MGNLGVSAKSKSKAEETVWAPVSRMSAAGRFWNGKGKDPPSVQCSQSARGGGSKLLKVAGRKLHTGVAPIDSEPRCGHSNGPKVHFSYAAAVAVGL